ncbi:hypothetical protein E4O04_05960 [Treponema sp. OMZ 799]|uniref:hypothetical protein n=1 Tax=Treponema sp. OMZ 799 TaxID=2563668 RepID=UPI0020A2F211|nr:hypothetical protein [Treponema sp. OMZ 799]UTC77569.1 hypothetical protein E4O04_05960 [Treponema sp. OMZ 799]
MPRRKKTEDEVREELKAANPHFTDEQIDELLAESFDQGDTEKDEPLTGSGTEAAALKAEIEAERLALEKEKEALALERSELEKDRAELDKKLTGLGEKLDTAFTGEEQEYVCNTACTFDGAYYRAGDILVTSKEVSEFFDPV